jgi:mRNA interferase MazF
MGYGIKRGDIFYISRTPVIGHEQFSGRPAIVVSCNANNKHCETVEIVYLTTQPKADLPTHVMIRSAKFQSTALCEQVTTVSTSRLGDYCGSCTREEMEEVNAAIMVSLGLCFGLAEQEEPCEEEAPEPSMACVKNESGTIARLEAERDTYRTMYESLLSKVIRTA